MNISNGIGLTETRVVGAIIQPILPAKLKPEKKEETNPAMNKQDIVKQIDSKSPQKIITMTLSALPKYSNYVQKCKFVRIVDLYLGPWRHSHRLYEL